MNFETNLTVQRVGKLMSAAVEKSIVLFHLVGDYLDNLRSNGWHDWRASYFMKTLFAFLLFAPFLALAETVTYYDCVSSNGDKSYRIYPCGKGQTELKKSKVDLNQFKNNKTASVGGSSNSINLASEQNGNFYAYGKINGFPVKFIVDTGASHVAVSQTLALNSGLTGCIPSTSQTANGTVPTCVTTAAEITIGDHHLRDVIVSILPNSTMEPLLGMSALSQFHIEQKNGLMRLSR
ncbi:MAG: retropepsin-like aspartic protease [Gallionellaceae bacterium]|nr:retropepsin-like aspartic protease [Gallionellaceae bacterium]